MMIICDTQALVFWMDKPEKLGQTANIYLEKGIINKTLACSDISLWEIGMIFSKKRLTLPEGSTIEQYLNTMIKALRLTVLPITPTIAQLAQSPEFIHGDPADRIIAATAIAHNATLITADGKLQQIPTLKWIW
jgi:PIN domain nuclease of toxin-antitoxin system